jgi:hypothetical protein
MWAVKQAVKLDGKKFFQACLFSDRQVGSQGANIGINGSLEVVVYFLVG